ncbi:MAG: toprim domain-containing protein [Chryseolinea sp.]
MMSSHLSFLVAKQIPITEYLSGLGFEPAKVLGTDCWYLSPFRDERTASFKVNTTLNLWYDHGSGEGGTILDLGAKLNNCTLSEFLDKLAQGNYSHLSFHRKSSAHNDEHKLRIVDVNLLKSADLLYYLRKRKISVGVATSCCKEVDFSIGQRIYKAIGFPNQSGGYELRNNWFKGSCSPKDISLINNNSRRICVLEGFMDYLSIIQLGPLAFKNLAADADFLVLNSLRLLDRSITHLQSHDEVNLFLDNDGAARQAKHDLTNRSIRFHDHSNVYQNHKDVNEFLVASEKYTLDRDSTCRSKGMKL